MSDWVATLIEQATQDKIAAQAPVDVAHETDATSSMVPKKRVSAYDHIEPQTDEDGTPVYAAPPFWARATATH